jgi:hypothetical protein
MNDQRSEDPLTRLFRDFAVLIVGILLGAISATLGIGYGLGIF